MTPSTCQNPNAKLGPLSKLFILCLLDKGPENLLDVLLGTPIRTGKMLASEVLVWIKMVSHHMQYKPKLHRPWTIKFCHDMPKALIDHFYSYVDGVSTSFGIIVDAGLRQVYGC